MNKRHYETYIIIDGNLDDSAIEEEIKKYESLLTKNEVEIVKTDLHGRKRLAYTIKKRQNGYYVCFEIIALPSIVTKLEKTYKLDENILRYLTIYVSSRSRQEKEEHLKNKAIMQSKYEEMKEKQNNISPEVNNEKIAEVNLPEKIANEVLQTN